MALIKCPDCGKDISDSAKTCLYCGLPLQDYFIRVAKNDNKTLYKVSKGFNKEKHNKFKKELKTPRIIVACLNILISVVLVRSIIINGLDGVFDSDVGING